MAAFVLHWGKIIPIFLRSRSAMTRVGRMNGSWVHESLYKPPAEKRSGTCLVSANHGSDPDADESWGLDL